jgi:peptidylprolyl isomerase
LRARTTTVALLATAALGTTACGSNDKTASTASAPAAAAAPTTTTVQPPDVTVTAPDTTPTTSTTAPAPAKPASISKNLKTKPEIPKPTGSAPTKLVVKDIVKGKGKTATAGHTVTVQYVGVSWSTGQQFDASWDRGQPFSFKLGAGMVIPGWDKGVAGMKVGGRRELIIPPDLAYGPQGQPPTIGPNETLIFVIDLLKVR